MPDEFYVALNSFLNSLGVQGKYITHETMAMIAYEVNIFLDEIVEHPKLRCKCYSNPEDLENGIISLSIYKEEPKIFI